MKKYNLPIDLNSIEWAVSTVGIEYHIKDNLWYRVAQCYECNHFPPPPYNMFFIAHKKPGATICYEIIKELFILDEGKIITAGSKVPLEKIIQNYKQKIKDNLYITGWSVEEYIINDML